MSHEVSYDPVDTSDAVEKLQNIGEGNQPSRVAQFANFIAGRLNDEVVPQGFVTASVLSVMDLQRGVDGFSGEPLEGDLVGLDKSDYDELLATVPELARSVFPKPFANAVLQHSIKHGIIPAPEAADKATLDNGEIITETIDNIEDAERLIVDDARSRLADLDWQHFGVAREEVEDTFNKTFALTLRNAPYNLPVNLMLDDRDHEAGLLQELLPAQKKHVSGPYWLAMTTDAIPPERSMLARDHIFLKGLEMVAVTQRLDSNDVIEHLAKDIDGPISRAAIRLQTFINDHPEEI